MAVSRLMEEIVATTSSRDETSRVCVQQVEQDPIPKSLRLTLGLPWGPHRANIAHTKI